MVFRVKDDSSLVQEACRSLCSQIITRETSNVKHTGLSLQREICVACFLLREVGQLMLIAW